MLRLRRSLLESGIVWDNQRGWQPDDPEDACTWESVQCDQEGRIVQM